MEVVSYTQIYRELKDTHPNLKINSPQTARNIYIKAIKKIRRYLREKNKESEIVEYLTLFSKE